MARQQRKSFSEALEPEQQRFLDEGSTPVASSDRPKAEDVNSEVPSKAQEPRAARPKRKEVQPTRSSARRGSLAEAQSFRTISPKIPLEYLRALKRVSLDRQLDGIEPWVQQDIVAEALGQWFSRLGVKLEP